METQTTIGKLTVQRRSTMGKGNARKLRAQGLIPAVLYGDKQEAIALTVNTSALSASLDPKKRHNTVIQLTVAAGENKAEETIEAMLKDYQIQPLRRIVLHADFIRITAETRIHVSEPLTLQGESPGIKLGGVLHQVFRELEVECKPADIPDQVIADVSALNIGDAVHTSDLIVPEGVAVLAAAAQTVVQVVMPRVGTTEDEATDEEGEGDAAADATEEKKED